MNKKKKTPQKSIKKDSDRKQKKKTNVDKDVANTINFQKEEQIREYEMRIQIGRSKYGSPDSRSYQLNSQINFSLDDMRKLSIQNGDYVLVFPKEDMQIFGLACSSNHTKKNMVVVGSIWTSALCNQGVTNNDLVTVKIVDPQLVSIIDTNYLELSVIGDDVKNSLPFWEESSTEKKQIVKYIHQMLLGRYFHPDSFLMLPIHGTSFRLKISSIQPSKQEYEPNCVSHQNIIMYRITSNTRVSMTSINKQEENYEQRTRKENGNFFEMIGGLNEQVQSIREIVELPLTQPEIFDSFKLPPPRGLLLYGPPGTGKTMIARAIAQQSNASVYIINGSEIISKFVGESEAKLRDIFQTAIDNAPSLIFIDEVDSLCPKRDDKAGEMEKRLVTTLLTLMDGLDSSSRLVILGATNRPNAIDPALRRPGRFDREFEIGIPNENQRVEILQVCLKNTPNSLVEKDYLELAAVTNGYVGADLTSLRQEACLKALYRFQKQENYDGMCPLVERSDFNKALNDIRPSSLREISVEIPKVYWSDIGGQDEIKHSLKECVEWPLKHADAFKRMGIRPPKGVLLYGPPGCSKTLIAKALATEGGMNFIAVKGPEIFSKWVGESEKAIQSIFKKARAAAPTIVFFDEIDAIAVQRGSADSGNHVADRVLSQLLNELDGIKPLKRVIIVAATNRPDLIDSALMRPGRIDRVLYVGPPNIKARHEILKVHTRRTPMSEDVDLNEIAKLTERYSGAELAAICREAILNAIEEDRNIASIKMSHFIQSLKNVKPQIDDDMVFFFEEFKRKQFS